MIDRCRLWENRTRTIQNRAAVVSSIILGTVWYVLSVLNHIRRVINQFTSNHKNIQREDGYKRGQLNSNWYYVKKEKSGWRLTPPLQTMEERRLALLRKYMCHSKQGKTPGWTILAQRTAQIAQRGWIYRNDDLLLWVPSSTNQINTTCDWARLSLWWRDTLLLWLNHCWRPKSQSKSIETMKHMPIWNNRLLSTSSSTRTCLHSKVNESDTKLRYRVYRALEFTTIKDLLRLDKLIMSRDELGSAIIDKMTLFPMKLDTVTPRSCTAFTKHIKKLWADAKEKWLSYIDNMKMPVEPTK